MKNQKSQLKTKKTVEKTLQSICVYKGKRNGFTLIEVIISLAIFSLLSIAIVNFINVSLKTNQKSEVKQQATLLGQSLLEELGSFNQLKIGSNELFGLSNVVVEDENCLNSQYCMNDLKIEDFILDISINLLKNNSDQQVQSFSNEKQEIGLSIEIRNNKVTGWIDNGKTKDLKVQDSGEVLEIFIDKYNNVFLKNSLGNKISLSGSLSNGKTKIEVVNNNGNNDNIPIKKVIINNESNTFLKGCLINKSAGPHERIEVEFNPENKGFFEESTDLEMCKFTGQTGSSANNGETDSPNNDGVNNSFQSTTTSDLYEVQINIYHNNSNELVFSGDRVLPLDFIREEEAK